MNVTIKQLRTFIAVADLESFTEAAKFLHLTQSALSTLVRGLEEELGVRLLDRSTRKVKLSSAGLDFYPHALKILRDLEDAVLSATQIRDKKRGYVKVAGPQLTSCTLLAPAIAEYRKEYPDIHVTLTDSLPDQVLSKVLSGQIELGVGPDLGVEPEITRQLLRKDLHYLVCRKDHPLAKRKRVTWKELESYPIISPTREFTSRRALELTMGANNILLKPAHEVSYMTTALGMAAAGLGVTFCPAYADPLVNGYGLQRVPIGNPDFVREVFIFTKRGTSLSPAAQSFVEFLHRFVVTLAERVARNVPPTASWD